MPARAIDALVSKEEAAKTSPLKQSPVEYIAQSANSAEHPLKGKSRKLILAGLVTVAVSGIALFAYFHNSHGIQYITTRIDRSDVEPTVTTSGNLNAVITVQVGSQVSGNIIALYADFNTKVKKGQLVALIDPAPFQAAADQAKASLNAAVAGVVTGQATVAKSKSDLASALANVANQKANVVKAQSAVDLAKIENDRAQKLLTDQIDSQDSADTAKAAYDQAVASANAAQAGVTAAEAAAESAEKQVDVAKTQLDQANAIVQQDAAALAQAQLNLDHTRILAPVDGTVESRNMDVGQTVAASFQAPIIFLIAQDLTKMQVDTNVDEADVGPIRVGQRASFTVDAYPGQVFVGEVAQIRQAPINVQNVITYDVVIDVSNADLKLFPGMTANATINTGHVPNALRIPKAALRFRPVLNQGPQAKAASSGSLRQQLPQSQSSQTIYVLDKQWRPKLVHVKLGVSDANFVEVTGGNLQEGQLVITGTTTRASSNSQLQTATPRRSGL